MSMYVLSACMYVCMYVCLHACMCACLVPAKTQEGAISPRNKFTYVCELPSM